MLTDAEKEWLERRKNLCTRCSRTTFCREGKRHGFNTYKCRFWGNKHQSWCKEDFHDDAEFEARVQKWLMYQYEKVFQCKEVSGGFMPGRATMLYFARLAAETKMDAPKS
ncbi:hypothetical protein [uncultured Desulfovibrio sp.]|uniref:hypothetical protein n=1 Tax=uncultured Desulfovibrio sp. TaxID=167968 RepID=UPI002627A3BF|nr:hypothetical protein [uncultured Desulfovibrio sp.]